MTRRVSLKSGKPYDVYCGRPSPYGNPFSSKEKSIAKYTVRTRKESLEKFKEYLLNNSEFQDIIKELKGKTLACWCDEKQRCHVDIIIEFLHTNRLF